MSCLKWLKCESVWSKSFEVNFFANFSCINAVVTSITCIKHVVDTQSQLTMNVIYSCFYLHGLHHTIDKNAKL